MWPQAYHLGPWTPPMTSWAHLHPAQHFLLVHHRQGCTAQKIAAFHTKLCRSHSCKFCCAQFSSELLFLDPAGGSYAEPTSILCQMQPNTWPWNRWSSFFLHELPKFLPVWEPQNQGLTFIFILPVFLKELQHTAYRFPEIIRDRTYVPVIQVQGIQELTEDI